MKPSWSIVDCRQLVNCRLPLAPRARKRRAASSNWCSAAVFPLSPMTIQARRVGRDAHSTSYRLGRQHLRARSQRERARRFGVYRGEQSRRNDLPFRSPLGRELAIVSERGHRRLRQTSIRPSRWPGSHRDVNSVGPTATPTVAMTPGVAGRAHRSTAKPDSTPHPRDHFDRSGSGCAARA